MKYLPDVNAMLALGHTAHEHNRRALAWMAEIRTSAESLGTCSITELGFVRVSVQAGLQPDVQTARAALSRMKASSPIKFEFINDPIGVDRMPAHVKKPADLTDGHLLELARHHGAVFATFDTGIPGAFVLP